MSQPIPVCNVLPDAPDFRDRMYSPTLRRLEPVCLNGAWIDRVRANGAHDQHQTNACTGFALAALVEALVYRAYCNERDFEEQLQPKSHWMLYFFARRYDEFQGDDDLGSSARAAMKAWHKHGAPDLKHWGQQFFSDGSTTEAPPPTKEWIQDGFRTPMGAYFRVDHTSVPDLHAAIFETGAVYVTAVVHEGWLQVGSDVPDVPFDGSQQPIGGHAFLLVGYDERGLWVQNSWGSGWGKGGFARISYRDWRQHGMDAWVAQLGVHITDQLSSLENGLQFAPAEKKAAADAQEGKKAADDTPAGIIRVSSSTEVRNQQINPYVVNLGNNGRLSDQGAFRTTEADLEELVGYYLNKALGQWQLDSNEPIHVALYAHGGLTGEQAAADTAARWVPALFARKIYPVFFMWETGLVDTIIHILEDTRQRGRTPAGGLADTLLNWKDDRLDNLVSRPGTALWSQMKDNAERASGKDGGLATLFGKLMQTPADILARLRFHLIGHSAGSIFHAHLAPHMVNAGLTVDGIYFMAPACTVELFETNLRPLLDNGHVKCYTQFHLEEFYEQRDTCTPLYNRSLLYMVSNAFEPVRKKPILGMQRYSDGQALKLSDPKVNLKSHPPHGARMWDFIASRTHPLPADVAFASEAISHGGFDNDPATLEAVLTRIARRGKELSPVQR